MTSSVVLFAMLAFFGRSPSPHHVTIAHTIEREAARRQLDPLLVAVVISRESSYDEKKIGTKHDLGLMQIRRVGVTGPNKATGPTRGWPLTTAQLLDPDVNVFLGTWYLSDQIHRCGSVAKGLGAYNSGRCRVTNYSRRTLAEYGRLRRAYADAGRVRG